MSKFIGRDLQLRVLDGALERVRNRRNESSPGRCVLVRGRRRVGKSRLAETFVERAGLPCVFFTSSRQGAGELRLFAEEVRSSDLPRADLFEDTVPSSWDGALRLLAQALPEDGPSVVVFDEFPYLIENDASVEATFQKLWDRTLSRKPVLLILIGSDLAMMENLDSHGRAFFQRGTEMVVPPFSPAETGEIVGCPDASSSFDAYLVTGGLPLVCDEWPSGMSVWEYLSIAVSDPTSALLVSAERSLAAEFPADALARIVLQQIGAGETTFTKIARAAGGLQASSLDRALDLLVEKRVVSRDLPLSTKPSKETRYRVADPYLRFWLKFLGPSFPEIERGRSDRVLDRIRVGWTTWRGRAVEPVVREALARLIPLGGIEGSIVGAYWTRHNDPEVDLVGVDRASVARAVTFCGSIKWLEHQPFDAADARALWAKAMQVPGAGASTPLVAVSRSGVDAEGISLALGPEELLAAWRAPQT